MATTETNQSLVKFSGNKIQPDERTSLQTNDRVDLKSSSSQETPKKKWTFLHYGAADNSLKDFITADVNEMEKVGSTDLMNVISMLDRGGSDCKIYYVKKDEDKDKLNSEVIRDMGETNMGDPKILTNFIVDMTKKYPAEHFTLILANHGKGWEGAFGDDSSKTKIMPTPNIRKAIEEAQKITGIKIDIIGFDACRMATGEVATELRNCADYLVAPEEDEGGDGWNYAPLLSGNTLKIIDKALRSRLNIAPKDFAKKMVELAEKERFSIPTLSAIDLNKIEKYEEAVNKFSQAILDTNTASDIFKEISKKTQFYSVDHCKDQYHFCELIVNSPEIKDESLKKAAQELMDYIAKELIIKEQHSTEYPGSHGITAEIPNDKGIIDPAYQDLIFAKETKWDEAMNKILS
jgi:hypothetical protein